MVELQDEEALNAALEADDFQLYLSAFPSSEREAAAARALTVLPLHEGYLSVTVSNMDVPGFLKWNTFDKAVLYGKFFFAASLWRSLKRTSIDKALVPLGLVAKVAVNVPGLVVSLPLVFVAVVALKMYSP